jgi:hypothetical protein
MMPSGSLQRIGEQSCERWRDDLLRPFVGVRQYDGRVWSVENGSEALQARLAAALCDLIDAAASLAGTVAVVVFRIRMRRARIDKSVREWHSGTSALLRGSPAWSFGARGNITYRHHKKPSVGW